MASEQTGFGSSTLLTLDTRALPRHSPKAGIQGRQGCRGCPGPPLCAGVTEEGRQQSPAWCTPLIDRETIEQPVAAGTAQVGLAAAAVGAARRMRGIPRFRRVVVAQALP